MSNNVTEITDANFEQLVERSVGNLVVIDFWAPWCAPCKNLSPVIEELATEFTNKAIFCKINVDENQEYARKYNIRSIPNLLFFKGGTVVEQTVGFLPKEQLVATLNKLI